MNKKTKKMVFNLSVIFVLLLAFGWVCSRFVHLGNVEFTDNARYVNISFLSIAVYKALLRKYILRNIRLCIRETHWL